MTELVYLRALKHVMETGEERGTRNAQTISTFGVNMEFDISTEFPLLTSKQMFSKGIFGELLWFIKGDTNALHLAAAGIPIWNANSSREYLDTVGLDTYSIGDCGPIYGFQWRRFNAAYHGCDYPYSSTDGVDQLAKCIELIRTDPTSRRIFMSAWNPSQMPQMALPPCHVSYQFYVTSENQISCSMYQRSGDMFLGVPFNIASSSALVYLLAHLTNKKPGKLIINIGDAHIYTSHIPQVRLQLSRVNQLYTLPSLEIQSRGQETIEDYVIQDFVISNYQCHPKITASMVA
jgi:thymidylate synthase